MQDVYIKFKKLRENARLPVCQKPGDAGYDCYISKFNHIKSKGNLIPLDNTIDCILKPLERIGCSLGFATEISNGYYAQVVPRSGLALWKGLSIVNSPATIDSGYRGEWMAIVINLSDKRVKLKVGERICQMIIRKSIQWEMFEVEELSSSERGKGGFGSTD